MEITGNLLKNKINLKEGDKHDVNKVTRFMLDLVRQQKRIWRKEIND